MLLLKFQFQIADTHWLSRSSTAPSLQLSQRRMEFHTEWTQLKRPLLVHASTTASLAGMKSELDTTHTYRGQKQGGRGGEGGG